MDVIRPVTITDAMLISSNVAESEYPLWAIGTTYALNAYVINPTDHHIYKSLQAANVGNQPTTSPAWWLDYGADNRWAMFDSAVNTQTVSPGSTLQVTLQPGGINSIGLINLIGSSVTVTLSDGINIVYSRTEDLKIKNAYNFYMYVYEPFAYRQHLIFTDIPNYQHGILTVTVTGINGAQAKCGVCAVGLARYLGRLQYNPSVGITDYSTKETDAFGNPTLVKRAYSKRMTCTLQIDNPIMDDIFRILADFRSEPMAWFGSELFESTIIFGYYKDFSIVIESYPLSTCNLEIEGLI